MNENEEIYDIDLTASYGSLNESIINLQQSAMPALSAISLSETLKSIDLNLIKASHAAYKAFQDINIPSISENLITNFLPLSETISSFLTSNIKISDSILSVSEAFKYIDFSPFNYCRVLFATIKDIEYSKYINCYCYIMIRCEWIPFLDYTNEPNLFININKTIFSISHQRNNLRSQIDKIMFDYYTEDRIKKIQLALKSTDIKEHYKKIISQTIDAYLREEYALTITCLATLWDALLFYKTTEREYSANHEINRLKKVTYNTYQDNKFVEIITHYYNDFLLQKFKICDDMNTLPDTPKRHQSAHGFFKEYPSKKAALNAILFTNFIINLQSIKPKEITENGQT